MSYGDYTSNLMPGVSLADIDRAAGVSPEDDGLWWDDEAGCWQDSEPEYCGRCGLLVPDLDSESGYCVECVGELAELATAKAAEKAAGKCPNCGCQPGERATDTYEDGAVAICLCDCHFPPAPVPRRERNGEVETA